ncbi:hypothetical protein DEU56DRAFT_985379 [Suillus clintonianus]|uniref:uncharacterized protein n=1 Tax=Suillus clintonianus TaxID=1904413 RepID=UPI001B86A131|nr:uncharacterized protein DEU56DRAFT_985379 [Suillus clintonianus]KAG2111129.1 hypothetical protein DEU56DRAFT_985379 [Suillus clintonianus]
MIRDGLYSIKNMFQVDRYVAMAGEDNDYEVVGQDVPDTIKVLVVNKVLGLATLFDPMQQKFIWIDDGSNRVVGRDVPQELQLSTEDGENYVIHKQDIDSVCVLNKNGKGTPIVTEPAPPPGVEGYKRKYWKFLPN